MLITGHFLCLVELQPPEVIIVPQLMLGGESERAHWDYLTVDFDRPHHVGQSVHFQEVTRRHFHLVLLVRVHGLSLVVLTK